MWAITDPKFFWRKSALKFVAGGGCHLAPNMVAVYRMRRCISNPPGPILNARNLTQLEKCAGAQKVAVGTHLAESFSEDVPFNTCTLFLRCQAIELGKPPWGCDIHHRIRQALSSTGVVCVMVGACHTTPYPSQLKPIRNRHLYARKGARRAAEVRLTSST